MEGQKRRLTTKAALSCPVLQYLSPAVPMRIWTSSIRSLIKLNQIGTNHMCRFEGAWSSPEAPHVGKSSEKQTDDRHELVSQKKGGMRWEEWEKSQGSQKTTLLAHTLESPVRSLVCSCIYTGRDRWRTPADPQWVRICVGLQVDVAPSHWEEKPENEAQTGTEQHFISLMAEQPLSHGHRGDELTYLDRMCVSV
ncbi:unnamed protein product [Pleuronectes platessa]|uniref:Uncharacterized protein n=1 Tax=Pleuronectes platessa TaxID=8262 RepID=A0A9N7UHZ8_PLEPL|nr:unnamed protein product [Pleuronectes platessa]